MAIYDLGTASLAANGEVTGVGTTWKAPLTLIRVGATIIFKTSPLKIYTISEIISDTQINVYNPNSETVPVGTGYAILAHDGITVQGLAQNVAETLRYYQSKETSIQSLLDFIGQDSFDWPRFEQLANQSITGAAEALASQVSAAESAATAVSARNTTTSARDATIEAINSAGDAGTLVTLANLGIATNNIPFVTTGSQFDWQTYMFKSGESLYLNPTVQVNAPAGMTFPVGVTRLYVHCTGARNNAAYSVTVSASNGNNNNYRTYNLQIDGARGSRVFTPREILTIPGGDAGAGGSSAIRVRGLLDVYSKNETFQKSLNFSDVANKSLARTNLDVYSKSEVENYVMNSVISEFSPERFGAITDNENFDCLPAIKQAIETGVLYLSPGKTYYVNDEVVIPSGLIMFTNSATIKASPNGDWFSRKKAVVRASSKNVGESPDLTMPEQQTRGVRHLGVLNIDANNLADHAYYGFGVVAESITDVIYAYNATNTGIVLIGSWYHKVNKYMSVNCARGVCIGYPINGETGDTFVNAISFGAVYAYDTTRSSTYGFDPYGNINAQLIGAGVILGKALGSSIDVLTAETTSGAGLATANAVNWSVNTAYFEKCGLSAIDPANPDVAILSTTANIEDHAIDFGNVHFGISTGIFHRYESTEFINIDSIYRIDRKITWNTNSKERSAYVKYGNYYYLDAYSYTKPKFITNESGVDVLLSDFGLVFRDYSNVYSRDFVFPGGDVYFNCGISTGSVSGLDFQITSDDGIQYITTSSSPYSIKLSGKRTAGNVYKISFATPNAEASGDGYVYLSRTKDTQWRQ